MLIIKERWLSKLIVYLMKKEINIVKKKLSVRGGAWEDAFLDVVGEAQDKGLFKHIRIARFASRTLDHELEKNTRAVLPYFVSTFVIMAIFSIGKYFCNSCDNLIKSFFQLPV